MLSLIAVLLLSGQAAAPDPCADPSNCRVVRDFELRAPDGRRVPVRTGERPTPWIVQDNVLLTPGDSLTVRFERDGEVLRPRRVRTGAASAATAPNTGEVRLSFAQAADGALTLTAESRAEAAAGLSGGAGQHGATGSADATGVSAGRGSNHGGAVERADRQPDPCLVPGRSAWSDLRTGCRIGR